MRNPRGARERASAAPTANGGQPDQQLGLTPDVVLSDKQPSGRAQQPIEDGGNFTHAVLDQAELSSADLSRASFNHANLAGADLSKANLKEASLRFAAGPIAGLAAADLSRADLQLARFDRANLADANLSGAVLDHTDFLGANLANANLKGASLRFAVLEEAKLDGADMSNADLRYARLNQADLAKANLSGSLLDYADFTGANLTDANLCGAQLRYAKNLTPGQLEQARTDDDTIRPFHYLELAPLSRTPRPVRRWHRPLVAAGLLALAGLAGMFASIDPIGQPQRSTSHAAPAIVAAPNATPILASLTPAILAPGPRIEIAAPRIGPASLTALSLYPTVVARTSDAMTSETPPSGLQPVPAQRLRLGGPAQFLPSSSPNVVSAVDVPLERLALAAPAKGTILSDAQSPVVAAIPAKLTIPVKEKTPKRKTPVAFNLDPLTMVVSLSQQKLDIYRGTTRVTSSKISSGKRGHETKIGVFSILEKRRHHRSNLYSNAPMPWMQRMTWSGTALHGGVVPGYPASHGCIRLPFSFAPKLFKLTGVGENVIVTHAKVVPKPIEHKTLFQPARAASPQVSMARADQDLSVASDIAARDATPQGTEQIETDAYDFAESTAPLRILITRRTPRDRIIGTQYVLASLGYLRRQNFTGRVGPETIAAIKAFQKANDLKVTGAFSEDVAKAIYRAAGKSDPPPGHLYVRQNFRHVFDLPVDFKKSKQTLGTHVFTAMKSPQETGTVPWMAISLEGDDSLRVLDRIEIPDHVRKDISERLTPGSTLIIADDSSHSAILRDGDDFIVSSNEEPIEVAYPAPKTKAKPAEVTRAKRRQAKPATVGKPRVQTRKAPPTRRSYRPAPHRGFWSFRRW